VVPESIRHFIGGRETYSSYRKTFGAPDPATGKEYTRVEIGVGADINQAVLAAESALKAAGWAGLPARERAGTLERIAAGIESRAGQIADFEALGTGLPVTQAREQASRAAECFRLAAGAIAAEPEDLSFSSPGRSGETLRRPAGVAGVVTSWRAPFLAQARAIAPALAAGCTIVLQADVWAPLSAALLPEITTAAGLPGGVLNIVHGTGDWRGESGGGTQARDALVAHPRVLLLSFAGDAAAGERAARDAAAHGKRLSADLAGNSPCVIFADADPDRAADSAAFGAFALNGARRTATTRILAERPVYDAVVARLAERAERVRVGDPSDPSTELGPLVHHELVDRVMSWVRLGLRDGARLAAGGRRPAALTEGNYLSATVLADVTTEMRIFAEVTCGPVACVTPFDTEEEASTAANAANATAPAPAAYIWTSDRQRARRLASAINSPAAWVNAHNADDQRTAPGGEDGTDFYAQTSAIRFPADDETVPRLGG
jgi:5-carboxymethyl-2-hydroxymuconic-semialdehyde dehydrogenase